MVQVDISKVNKVELLKALWENAKPASFFAMNGMPTPPWNQKMAEEAVTKRIDYFQGRCIKADLSGDTVDPWLYDRDFGKNRFQEIVEELLEENV